MKYNMKIWLDDLRKAPDNYIWCHSVNEAISVINEAGTSNITDIDIDHDLGDYNKDGGEGIKLIDWCIENDFYPNVKLHTANPVGRNNMLRTIKRYWKLNNNNEVNFQ